MCDTCNCIHALNNLSFEEELFRTIGVVGLSTLAIFFMARLMLYIEKHLG